MPLGKLLKIFPVIGTNLESTNFIIADLSGANSTRAYLCHADFEGANLSDADMTEADLTLATFVSAWIVGLNLTGARLAATTFGKTLCGALLRGVDLTDAIFSETNLSRVDLMYSHQGTFSGDEETRSYFWRANLTEAYLNSADLTGAIMPDGTKHE